MSDLLLLADKNNSWLVAWFATHGFRPVEALRAARSFMKWRDASLRKRREDAIKRHLVARTAGLHVSAISHYWSVSNWSKLSDETRRSLDSITRDLGADPPVRTGTAIRIRGVRRLALLAELSNAPSPRFHLEAIRSIAESAERLQFSVSIHDVGRRGVSESAPLSSLIHRIHNHSRPNAVAFLRMTPDDDSLELLFDKGIPTIVIHGDLRKYRNPVIGHVVPYQEHISSFVRQWARQLDHPMPVAQAVIAAMPPEPGGATSIRNRRVALIEMGLRAAGLRANRFTVPNYSAANAMALVSAHPEAAAFVCLSDELALGVAHLLIASGRPDGPSRVLGFDGSPMARRYGIATIPQRLNRIGDAVAETLAEFFVRYPATPDRWPDPREILVR